MTATELQSLLQDAIEETPEELQDSLRRVFTFEACGVLTNDAGLVLRMKDGSEFQLTIIQSR